MGFTRDLEKAGSVVVETAVEHVGLFFVAKKVGLEGSSLMLVQATDIFFLSHPSGPSLTGEGLCHVEFKGALGDARNWFVGSADIKNALHHMRIAGWLQAFFALR